MGFTLEKVLRPDLSNEVTLRKDMDNLLARLEHGVVLVAREALDILLLDELVLGGYHDAALAGGRKNKECNAHLCLYSVTYTKT